MKALNVEGAVRYAKSQFFAPDARVTGYLVEAQIGQICYGFLHGADLPEGENFVCFEAVGTDNRNGYNIVQTADGVAYAIITTAEHPHMDCSINALKAHIACNKEWYAARKAATWH